MGCHAICGFDIGTGAWDRTKSKKLEEGNLKQDTTFINE